MNDSLIGSSAEKTLLHEASHNLNKKLVPNSKIFESIFTLKGGGSCSVASIKTADAPPLTNFWLSAPFQKW